MSKIDTASRNLPMIYHAEQEIAGVDYYWNNRSRSDTDNLIIQRTISGEAYLELNGVRTKVPKGFVMLFRHGDDSSYGRAVENEEPYLLNYVAMSRSGGLGALFSEIVQRFGSVISMDENLEAARILDELVDSFASGKALDQINLAEMAYRLMLAIYREQVMGSQKLDPVGYGRHLIMNQFRSPVNLKELIREIGISREHFTRVFKHRYKENPANYLRSLRLNHGRILIRTTSLSIEDIAPACGFSSAQTFRRAYQNHFGRTVGSDRKH